MLTLKRRSSFRAFYCSFCVCFILGCGGYNHYTIKTVVTLDGKPLTDAEVLLLPVRKNAPSASGITDAHGEAVFKMEDKNGVLPGSYIVTVSKIVEERRLTNDEIRALAEVGTHYRPQMVELVSPKYTRRETSDLTIKVGYWQPSEWTFDILTEEP